MCCALIIRAVSQGRKWSPIVSTSSVSKGPALLLVFSSQYAPVITVHVNNVELLPMVTKSMSGKKVVKKNVTFVKSHFLLIWVPSLSDSLCSTVFSPLPPLSRGEIFLLSWISDLSVSVMFGWRIMHYLLTKSFLNISFLP